MKQVQITVIYTVKNYVRRLEDIDFTRHKSEGREINLQLISTC